MSSTSFTMGPSVRCNSMTTTLRIASNDLTGRVPAQDFGAHQHSTCRQAIGGAQIRVPTNFRNTLRLC
jgi:hypothetical protein